jgi:hypothetical protein
LPRASLRSASRLACDPTPTRKERAKGKGEGKAEGKGEGKESRREGKAGRIRVDIDGEGATTVDVKCAEGEPMRACADLTKEIVDKIRAAPVKQ